MANAPPSPPIEAPWTHCVDLLTWSAMWAIIDAAPDAMLVCDDDGVIVAANEQAERTFGYCRAELFGQPVEMSWPPTATLRTTRTVPATRPSPSAGPWATVSSSPVVTATAPPSPSTSA